MEVILVRHGETKHNVDRGKESYFAGSLIDDSLTEEGSKGIGVLANKIAKIDGIDAIVCSSLKRSKQTAEIISKKIGVRVIEMEELDEVNVGDFSGHTMCEVKKLYPFAAENFYSNNVKRWNFPNGENYGSLNAGAKSFLKKLTNLNLQKLVLVGHGMFNWILIKEIDPKFPISQKRKGFSHDQIVKLNYEYETNK